MWIDSHCHLDAPDFDADRKAVIAAAKCAKVKQIVIPAVSPEHFERTIAIAHEEELSYALGLHPLWMGEDLTRAEQQAHDEKIINQIHQALEKNRDDSRLVAVGEIGLDYFVKELSRERQWFFYLEQLKLAKAFKLPVILHVRRSADMLLKGLRQVEGVQGIVHAFNGSEQQAKMFINHGFKLGFGGALTFERAKQIRHLLQTVPLSSIVLETDAPDIPPHWVYKTAEERAGGTPQGRNEPAELRRIAQEVARLCKLSLEELSEVTLQNTVDALPKLRQLL